MKHFIYQNKYHLLGLFLIIIMFFLSYIIRQDNLSVPMSRHHELITSHTLITCQIWDEAGGPSNFHFAPVYTYPGKGNRERNFLGGIVDDKGDAYYVANPPFAFLFAYYAMQILGGPDEVNIRTLNLLIHLFCVIFIYLITVLLLPKMVAHQVSMGGLMAANLYLFSTGNLWAHGNLYFADILMQPILIFTSWLIIYLINKKRDLKIVHYTILGVVFFIAVYTEWLGLFFALIVGLVAFIVWVVNRKKKFLFGFIVITCAALISVTTTIVQYSSIDGFSSYKNVYLNKYTEPNGHDIQDKSTAKFNLENDINSDFMFERIALFYGDFFWFYSASFVLLLLLILLPGAKMRLEHVKVALILFGVLFASILTHYYLFFKFNSLHDYSSLKTGFLIIFCIAIIMVFTQSILSNKANIVYFTLATISAIFIVHKSSKTYERFFPLSKVDWQMLNVASAIKANANPDQLVFINSKASPVLFYYAHHNTIYLEDTSLVASQMVQLNVESAQYYFSRNNQLEYIQEYELLNDKAIPTKKLFYNGSIIESSKIHQK